MVGKHVSSQVTPKYAMYPMYKHPGYLSIIAVSCKVGKKVINYESAALAIFYKWYRVHERKLHLQITYSLPKLSANLVIPGSRDISSLLYILF